MEGCDVWEARREESACSREWVTADKEGGLGVREIEY